MYAVASGSSFTELNDLRSTSTYIKTKQLNLAIFTDTYIRPTF